MTQKQLDLIDALRKIREQRKLELFSISRDINNLLQDCNHKQPDGTSFIYDYYCTLCGKSEDYIEKERNKNAGSNSNLRR